MGLAEIRQQVLERHGFLTKDEVNFLATQDETRLLPLLVRCGRCRFTAPAQDVDFLAKAVFAAGDYVRDVSLPLGVTLPGSVTVTARGTGHSYVCRFPARHAGSMATIPCQNCEVQH